ncbi:MAG: hypothetical protein AVDCRST_MAG54-3496, partial [uncultured Actinomycetospora sp.]
TGPSSSRASPRPSPAASTAPPMTSPRPSPPPWARSEDWRSPRSPRTRLGVGVRGRRGSDPEVGRRRRRQARRH